MNSESAMILNSVKDNVREIFQENNIMDMPDQLIESIANRILQKKEKKPANKPEFTTSSSGSSSTSGESDDISMTDDDQEPSDESDYILVQNKRRPRNAAMTTDSQMKKSKGNQPKSTNYYEPLAHENRFVIPPKQKPTTEKSTSEKPPSRPPPIVTHGLNYKEFNEAVKGLNDNEKPKFFIKIGTGRKCTIKPITEGDRKAIFELLSRMKVESYTFTPKSERKTTLVLKGVQHTFDEEDIKVALEEKLSGLIVKSVVKLVTPRSKAAGKLLNAFIVTFEAAYDIKRIMEVKSLYGQFVHWEKHNVKGISQCKRCQRYGHVASNCAQIFRCVKCSEKHGPGECRRMKHDENQKPFCVNCQEEGHPANYRGCPKYKDVIGTQKKRRQHQKQREIFIREATRNYVQPGMSFSQVLSNKQNKPNTPANTNITQPQQPIKRMAPQIAPKPNPNISHSNVDNFCTQEAKALFGCDLFALMGKINNFIPQYRKLTSLAERQSAFLQFAFTLCLGN